MTRNFALTFAAVTQALATRQSHAGHPACARLSRYCLAQLGAKPASGRTAFNQGRSPFMRKEVIRQAGP